MERQACETLCLLVYSPNSQTANLSQAEAKPKELLQTLSQLGRVPNTRPIFSSFLRTLAGSWISVGVEGQLVPFHDASITDDSFTHSATVTTSVQDFVLNFQHVCAGMFGHTCEIMSKAFPLSSP